MPETVKIWRCAKWSFAITRPKKHRRWVAEGEPGYDYANVDQSLRPLGVGGPHGHLVLCGPFESWTATKDEP